MLPRWVRAAAHPRRAAEVARALARFVNGAALVRAYLRLAEPAYPFTLRARAGTAVRIESWHDAATAWIVFCREEYAVPADARCIVDIGANWGAFALHAAARAPAARIFAVEPHPEEHPRLLRTIAANGLDGRVTVWQLAVAGEPGERWMDADPAHPGPSRGIHPAEVDAPPPASVQVQAVTLAQLLDRARTAAGAERIDLVKMDIEGAEHEVLPHLPPQVLAPVDAWQMEYHPNGPKAPLFAALQRAGLRPVHDDEAGPNSGVAHFRR
ncbi:MAG TPA: FkbM family methyltransferase [Longimicrobium sp.]|nr:FkbM family methyltransferase [Longimicrobium sp.]